MVNGNTKVEHLTYAGLRCLLLLHWFISTCNRGSFHTLLNWLVAIPPTPFPGHIVDQKFNQGFYLLVIDHFFNEAMKAWKL